MIAAVILAAEIGIVGSQSLVIGNYSEAGEAAILRTGVSEACRAAMIELHGQATWDLAVAQQAAIDDGGGAAISRVLTEEELGVAYEARLAGIAPIGTGIAILFLLAGLTLALARGVAPAADPRPLWVGFAGVALGLVFDIAFVRATTSSGTTFVILLIPLLLTLYGLRRATTYLGGNELLRVVFPPLVLIIAVLGSILGGVTNPTPAAALGAGGAIMLAAYRRLRRRAALGPDHHLVDLRAHHHDPRSGINFDLRDERGRRRDQRRGVDRLHRRAWAPITSRCSAYYTPASTLLRGPACCRPSCARRQRSRAMVFTILIGSQLLNLVVISFGGEHYIQQFLRSFDNEMVVFLIVMLVLFILGFVLDFLEIIYIVVPIVGPVIYGGTLDPSWVTIMIAVNLQTSFLTPPFGFALFYLRGVAPKEVTTGQIYKGVIPFVGIQVVGLLLLWLFPGVVTIVPDLLN